MTTDKIELYSKEELKNALIEQEDTIYLDACDRSFCFKLRQLYKSCLAADTVTNSFGEVINLYKVVVIDISTLSSKFMHTKGVEHLDDLYKLIKTDFARNHLIIKVVYEGYVPDSLLEIAQAS